MSLQSTAYPTCANPKCKAPLDSSIWNRDGHHTCPECSNEVEVLTFPARDLSDSGNGSNSSSARVIDQSESTCYVHQENRAQAVCHECGKFMCSLCEISLEGKSMCPSCLNSARQENPQEHLVKQSPNVVSITGMCAAIGLLPPFYLITFIIGIITGPVILYYTWFRNRSKKAPWLPAGKSGLVMNTILGFVHLLFGIGGIALSLNLFNRG